jgi:putative transposase
MPRRPRAATGGIVYHVLNRAAGRRQLLFRKPADYLAFERVLAEACRRFPGVRVLAYCLMPTHWHLVPWPRRDGELSDFVRWLSVTHAQRDHAHRKAAGTGPLYQGRFKSFPVRRDDAHLLTVCRYVERNALRRGLVRRAQDWPWCSLARREAESKAKPTAKAKGRGRHDRDPGGVPAAAATGDGVRPDIPLLPQARWPAEPRPGWAQWVNAPETDAELEALRRSLRRGAPYGDERWALRTAGQLGLLPTLRPRGRPPKPQPERGGPAGAAPQPRERTRRNG